MTPAEARERAGFAAYFEARLALLDRPDARLYVRDGEDPWRTDLVAVVADLEHRGRLFRCVAPVSTGNAHERNVLAHQGRAMAAAFDRLIGDRRADDRGSLPAYGAFPVYADASA